MDDYVAQLMRIWGFGNHIEALADNDVDFNALKDLTESDLAQIFPKAGTRSRFRACWKKWRDDLAKAEESRVNNNPVSDSPAVGFDSPSGPALSPIGSGFTALLDLDGISYEGSDSSLLDPQSGHRDTPPPVHSGQQVNSPLLQPSTSQGGGTAKHTNSVRNLLQKTPEGRSILLLAKKENLFDHALERRLSQYIVRQALEDNPDFRLTRNDFTKWSLEIPEIFVNANPLVFFTPYTAGNAYQSKRNAAGRLYEAYINLRRKFRKRGDIPPSGRSSRTVSSGGEDSTWPTKITYEANDVEIEALNYLRLAIEPWQVVSSNWEKTFQARQRDILTPGTLTDYFDQYPALKTPAGYTLLVQDFNRIYPGKENSLFFKLAAVKDRLLGVLLEKSKQKELAAHITPYLTSISDDTSSSVVSAAILLSLPALLSLSQGKKGKWRPSRTEVREGFISNIPTDADLDEAIRLRQAKLRSYKLTFQPWIVFSGPSISEVSNAHIIIDEVIYTFNCLLTAVDTAFKIFHAAGAKYPFDCECVWLILQRAIYNIETPYDRVNQSVRSIMTLFE